MLRKYTVLSVTSHPSGPTIIPLYMRQIISYSTPDQQNTIMNSHELRQQLEQLDDTSWQQLLAGKALRLVDDERLELAEPGERNLVVPQQGGSSLDVPALREQLLSQAGELIEAYYLRNPLSLKAFNHQVRALVEQYGAAAFAAEYGALPERTLYVDGDQVIAESSDSPRHPYGAFCELDEAVAADALSARVADWLGSDEAYEKYISMNVCRYSC